MRLRPPLTTKHARRDRRARQVAVGSPGKCRYLGTIGQDVDTQETMVDGFVIGCAYIPSGASSSDPIPQRTSEFEGLICDVGLPSDGKPSYADSGTRFWDAVPVGVMQHLRDLDARGGSVLPASTETRRDYLERLAAGARGVVGPALSALAREVLEQRRTIAALKVRLAEVEERNRVTCPSLRISRRTSLRTRPVLGRPSSLSGSVLQVLSPARAT